MQIIIIKLPTKIYIAFFIILSYSVLCDGIVYYNVIK